LAFGAIKGEYFDWTQAWRLVASQWLHVQAPHMLLNALVLGSVGWAAETRWGRILPAAIALMGGTLSQALLVLLEPQNFLSGASQAYMALCGFLLVAGGRMSRGGRILACAGILIGLAIDIFISVDGQIKFGHAFPIFFGMVSGLVARTLSKTGSIALKETGPGSA